MADRKEFSQIVERLLLEQRRRRLAGELPRIEDQLAREEELTDRDERMLVLAYAEFCLREELGETPQPEEYLARFPHLAEQLQDLFDVHRVLRRHGTRILRIPEEPPAGAPHGERSPARRRTRPPGLWRRLWAGVMGWMRSR